MDSKYLVTIVKSDLQYLTDEWTQDIDDESLRRSSNVLRILLVDNALLHAWHHVGFKKQPKIKAPSLEYTLSYFDEDKIVFAQAGGAKFKGLEVRTVVQLNYALSAKEVKHLYEATKDIQLKEYWLNEFVEATCMVISGNIVNRRELIQYVANKLGGTHIDTKRDVGGKSERKHKKGQGFVVLDILYDTIKIADKNAIFYELLSIGQSLINSEDIKLLMDRIK